MSLAQLVGGSLDEPCASIPLISDFKSSLEILIPLISGVEFCAWKEDRVGGAIGSFAIRRSSDWLGLQLPVGESEIYA